jgi:hypothetical protein
VIEGKFFKPSNAYKDKASTKTNQEDMATFHCGEQGELEDITKHVGSKLSKVTRKRPTNVVEPKTPWEPIWDPTKNPTFWYRKAVVPSFYIHEDEIVQLEK